MAGGSVLLVGAGLTSSLTASLLADSLPGLSVPNWFARIIDSLTKGCSLGEGSGCRRQVCHLEGSLQPLVHCRPRRSGRRLSPLIVLGLSLNIAVPLALPWGGTRVSVPSSPLCRPPPACRPRPGASTSPRILQCHWGFEPFNQPQLSKSGERPQTRWGRETFCGAQRCAFSPLPFAEWSVLTQSYLLQKGASK